CPVPTSCRRCLFEPLLRGAPRSGEVLGPGSTSAVAACSNLYPVGRRTRVRRLPCPHLLRRRPFEPPLREAPHPGGALGPVPAPCSPNESLPRVHPNEPRPRARPNESSAPRPPDVVGDPVRRAECGYCA